MSGFEVAGNHSLKISMLSIKLVTIISIAFLTHGATAFADATSPDSGGGEDQRIEYKLSLSNYSTQSVHANDINLRADQGNQRGWIGYYKEGSSGFEQWRVGYERTDRIISVDIDTSLQAAAHGFWGGSVTATVGEPFFAMIGYGRTNLKPYANLNFDPNDAITLGAGYKKTDGSSLTLFLVRDDRVVPGQQNLHLLIRLPLPNQQRISLDIFNKSGPADQGQSIKGIGASVTYDWPSVFLRLAYDPKVNFTQENMTRASIGMRF
ncbi:MAG: hypothetical protein ACXW11_08255 [Methylotenera sp.]